MIIADYSQWQGVVTPAAGSVVIIRAHSGYGPDPDFAANRAAAHRVGCPAVGIYQYLAADRDPAVQASELLQLIGHLAGDEWLICDLEAGGGDQQPRWATWRLSVTTGTAGRQPWLYSGLSFADAHDLDPQWVAAYGPNEPTIAHRLWQNTDTYPWPWGASDASVFHGTLPEFLAAAGIVSAETAASIQPARPAASPPPIKEDPAMVLANDGHAQYVVTTAGDGHLVKNPIPALNDPAHPELAQISAVMPNLGTVPAFLAAIPAGPTA